MVGRKPAKVIDAVQQPPVKHFADPREGIDSLALDCGLADVAIWHGDKIGAGVKFG